jgi:hypothetical protein
MAMSHPQALGTGSDPVGHDRRFRLEEWFNVLLCGGLAGVFIVNALIAWLQPGDFVDLVRRSALSWASPVRPGRWVAWAICFNDLVLGILLVVTIRSRRTRAVVLAWSGVWLLCVTVIKVTSLDVFVS